MTVHIFELRRRDRIDAWLLNWKTPFWICQSSARRMGRWKTTDKSLKFHLVRLFRVNLGKMLNGSNCCSLARSPQAHFARQKSDEGEHAMLAGQKFV